MDLRRTINDLYDEKAKLDRVIASLEQLNEEAQVPQPVARRGRKFMNPQERRMVSERMRRYWAMRKAATLAEPERIMATASVAASAA